MTPLRRLLLQLTLLLLCYFISRCVFAAINNDIFKGLTVSEFLRIAFFSLRFDLSVILLLNSVYIILIFLPIPSWRISWWDKLLQWVFIVINVLALCFELSDWAYFPFTLKRSTSDVLDMITRKGDFLSLLPHFLVAYWYVPIAFVALVILFVGVNRSIAKITPIQRPGFKSGIAILGLQTLMLLTVAVFCIIGIRGGIQRIPISNSNAVQITDSRFVPIVLNTPFSIVHTFESNRLEDLHYYTDTELKNYFNPVKQYSGKTFRPKNVVLIILESYSKQFTGLGGRKSYTPFLDELMQRSFVCTNAYANALHSAEGIPAVIAGIPSLMEEPFTTSSYGTNQITAIPSLLKEKGYSTVFYHGGTNGTMSFDAFAANAGYDKYYGRYEYANEKDYDGNWGIWDEPFLQYFAKGMEKMKQPFFSTIFTLSSHEPFKVPDQYKNVLPQGSLPVEQAMAYTDLALRKFFDCVSKQSWFNNTLFVLSADHCSLLSERERDHYNLGFYEIPILFYVPGDSSMRGITHEVMQQIDILPSIMDYLGYEKPFFAFGNSIFTKTQNRFAAIELDNSNKWLMNGCFLKAKGQEIAEVYNYSTDSLCFNNLYGKPEDTISAKVIPYFKAFHQLYRSSLIHNTMKLN